MNISSMVVCITKLLLTFCWRLLLTATVPSLSHIGMQKVKFIHPAINFLPICIFSIISLTRCEAKLEDQDCLNLLPENYKKHQISETGKTTNITFELEILNLDEIHEANMDFRLDTYIHALWVDERLVKEATPIRNNRCEEYLWMPNIIFETAKAVDTFGKHNTILVISREKLVHRILRFSLKVGCEMNFESYPFDTQKCALSIRLMGNSDNDIYIRWPDSSSNRLPIQLKRKIDPLQFYLRKPTPDKLLMFNNGVPFTVLRVNFTFVRRLTGSLVNIYAPSTLIVAVSWVTFWLRLEAAPARVALSITSLLTLCTQAQQHKSQLPPLNYVTAVDIWLFVCTLMVFSTLVEFAISYNSYTERKIKETPSRISSKTSNCRTKVNPVSRSKHQDVNLQARNCNRYCGCSWFNGLHSLDVLCRKLFPLVFMLFAITYWTYYLNMYYNKEDLVK